MRGWRTAAQIQAELDTLALTGAGYDVEIVRQFESFVETRVTGPNGATLIDWTQSTAWRFFPAVADPEFGWRLHDLDLAVNKVLALAGRREPRDYHDVVSLIRDGVPLSGLA